METWMSPEAAQAWRLERETRDRTMQLTTNLMFEQASLRPGSRVLEVAAGAAELSMQAAVLVSPGGTVVATDISEAMLNLSHSEIAARSLGNITTQVANASALPFAPMSFDVIICRNGVMFIDGLDEALKGMAALLTPGGRLVASVWSGGARNVRMAVLLEVVKEFGATFASPPTLERALGLGDSEHLRQLFGGAGLDEISVTAAPAIREHATASAAIADLTNNHGPSRELLDALDATQRARALSEVETRFRRYEGPDGCFLPGEQLVAAGTRPHPC